MKITTVNMEARVVCKITILPVPVSLATTENVASIKVSLEEFQKLKYTVLIYISNFEFCVNGLCDVHGNFL